MSTTVEKIENALEDVLPLVELALPLIIPGAAIPAATAKLLEDVLKGIEAIATNKLDAATMLARLKPSTSAQVAADNAIEDAKIKAQYETKTPAV